jgi:hypothetical protein
MDSMLTRPAAERVISGPEALITGTIPKSFQCMAPCPSTKLSPPRMDMPCIRTVARQIIPRPHRIICSAENLFQPFSLISPCILRRPADARGVPPAIECLRYRRAASGSSETCAGSKYFSAGGADSHRFSNDERLIIQSRNVTASIARGAPQKSKRQQAVITDAEVYAAENYRMQASSWIVGDPDRITLRSIDPAWSRCVEERPQTGHGG